MTNQNLPQEPEKQAKGFSTKTILAPATQKVKDSLRSKRAWVFLALILFLLSLGTVVPVGKIPFLRSLAYAMGYSPQDAQRLSLFQALFSWSEHQKIMRGERPDPSALDVFGPAEMAQRAAEQEKIGKRGAQGALLNIQAVNALRRRQGQSVEQVAGASGSPLDSDQEDATGIGLTNPNASANTEANSEKIGEVYFGQDTSVIIRDQRDGYNSVNSLKRASSPIAGVSSSNQADWFLDLADRATKQDSQLGELQHGLEQRGFSAGVGKLGKLGNGKASRDLYWAWLTGRAAKRTPHMLLKKTLAAAAFNGAELPTSVFTTTGFSGVAINPDSVLADIDSVKKYLKVDEKCKAALEAIDSAAYTAKLDQMRTIINNLSVPSTCANSAAGAQQFANAFNRVESTCNEMKYVYNDMKANCGALNISTGDDKCDEVGFSSQAEQFNTWCQSQLDDCNSEQDPAACRAKVASREWDEFAGENKNERWTQSDLKKEINVKYYRDGDPEKGFNSGYFPSADWGESLWVDTSVAD